MYSDGDSDSESLRALAGGVGKNLSEHDGEFPQQGMQIIIDTIDIVQV